MSAIAGVSEEVGQTLAAGHQLGLSHPQSAKFLNRLDPLRLVRHRAVERNFPQGFQALIEMGSPLADGAAQSLLQLQEPFATAGRRAKTISGGNQSTMGRKTCVDRFQSVRVPIRSQ